MVASVTASSTRFRRSTRGAIDEEHPGGLRVQVAAPRGRLGGADAGTRDRGAHHRSGAIFGEIVFIDLGRDDLVVAGGAKRGEIALTEHAALLEHLACAEAQRVPHDGAERAADGDPAEAHRQPRRSCSTIWARMDTAISAGERAPIRRPTGPKIRAIVRLVEAASAEALEPASVGLSAAEAAHVEGLRAERDLERGVVELGVVGERHHGGARVEVELFERAIGPGVHKLHAGKAGLGGEGRAGVDHDDLEAGERRHLRERLGDVHGADEDEAQRGIVRLEEGRGALASLDRDTLIAIGRAPGRLVELGRVALGARLARVVEALFPGGDRGREHGDPLALAVFAELLEGRDLHSSASTKT